MRLLFDQNLSPKLVERLSDLYPGSGHVQQFGLDLADDGQVWDHARDHGFTIVSKDADFSNMAVVRGIPPKVIWLLIGNCTTTQIETLLRANHSAIDAFGRDPTLGTLSLR